MPGTVLGARQRAERVLALPSGSPLCSVSGAQWPGRWVQSTEDGLCGQVPDVFPGEKGKLVCRVIRRLPGSRESLEARDWHVPTPAGVKPLGVFGETA